jgi:methylglutamate dehydrogenase subunit D
MAERHPDPGFDMPGFDMPGFGMTELTGWALVQLAFRPGIFADLDAAFLRLTGGSLPRRPGDVAGRNGIEAFRLAPRRIWILGESGMALSGLIDAAATHAAVLSLAEGRRRYRLGGTRCLEVLAKGIALDLEGSGLPPGRVAETQLHRMPILLHRRHDGVELFVARSFAASFEDWIADAALEVGWRPAAREKA